MQIIQWIQIIEASSSTAAILLNGTLIPLIMFRSSKSIGTYKYLLLALVITELLHSVCVATTLPINKLKPPYWLLYSTSGIDASVAYYCLAAQVWLYIQMIFILEYSFIYRYAAVCREELLDWFKKPRKIIILSFILLVFSSLFAAEVTILDRPKYEDIRADISQNGYVGILFFNSDGSYRIFPRCIIYSRSAIFSTLAITGVFTTLKIRKAFKDNLSFFSQPTLKLQKRLFHMLLLQTAFPLVFQVTPLLISSIFAITNSSGGSFSQLISSISSLVPALDPLLIFIYLKAYRNSLRHILCAPKLNNQTNVLVIAVSSSTSGVRNSSTGNPQPQPPFRTNI